MDFFNGDGVLSLVGTNGDGVVRTSGNQTIRGVKTFKDTLIEEGTIQCSRLDANFILSKTPADYLVVQANTTLALTAGDTIATTAENFMNLTSVTDNINFDTGLALQHNRQTFNPRRQYNLNYRNGLTTRYYGIEIIRAVDDPNNVLSPAPVNGRTYIEIFSNGNNAASYNSSRLAGVFLGQGNSDGTTQTDFLISQYEQTEPTFGPIYSGGTSTNYLSFVFYLIGGFNYTIITDGVVGNYWNNNTTTPLWALTGGTTYNTGATATFAIIKNNNSTFTDNTGTTASVLTIATGAQQYMNFNIYNYTANRANKYRLTDSKQISPEQYVGNPTSGTACVPMVNFTKIGYRNGGSSSSMINWGLDATNVSLLAQLPYKSRCVAVDVVFDNDATPPTVATRFQAYLGNSNAVGSNTYLDTAAFITITSTSWSTTTGWAEATNIPNQDLVIPAGTSFYGSWRLVNQATLAAVTLNQEFIITFYFQQIP